jgi:acetoacetyl-CoA synthetase
MDAKIYSETGSPLANGAGELVCTSPFPSRPLYFWNDPGNSRYYEAYYARFPGVWTHGDLAELTEHDGLIIFGRSDAVLNRSGVRIGTAEIYTPLEKISKIADALVVDRNLFGQSTLILFVQLNNEAVLDSTLENEIRKQLKEYASTRHLPDAIVQVPAIPYTVNGKKVELAIKALLEGRPIKNLGSIANPDALGAFAEFARTKVIRQP